MRIFKIDYFMDQERSIKSQHSKNPIVSPRMEIPIVLPQFLQTMLRSADIPAGEHPIQHIQFRKE